jgi:hypothetical protein
MLKYLKDQNIKVGDRIRVYDFPDTPDCYVEGKVYYVDMTGEQGFKCIDITVDKEAWINPPHQAAPGLFLKGKNYVIRTRSRVKSGIHVPMQLSSDWDGRIVNLSEHPRTAPKTSSPTGEREELVDDEQARAEVLRRFGAWGRQSVPARKYALLVAGYFRSRCGPSHDQPIYLGLLNHDGLALLELIETSADRPLTTTERARAVDLAHRFERWDRTKLDGGGIAWSGSGLPVCLQLTLDDPQRGTARLIGYPGAVPDTEHAPCLWHPSVLRVMECLRPAVSEPAAAWTPPADALLWARRIYEIRDLTDLPVLADLLEDAECPDHSLLGHCRRHPEHFRGCAALDRLLGF